MNEAMLISVYLGAMVVGASIMYPIAFWLGYKRCLDVQKPLWFAEGQLDELKRGNAELRVSLR